MQDNEESFPSEESLGNQVATLNEAIAELANRIEIADILDQRQTNLNKLVKRINVISVIQTIILSAVILLGAQFYVGSNQQTAEICRGANEIRSAETRLWSDLIKQNPIEAPGPGATPEDIAEYNKAVKRTNDFIISLEENFALQEC